MLGLGPPRLRLGPLRALGPAARPPLGLRSRPPGRPLGPAGAGVRCGWLGPLRALGGRSGGAWPPAGRLRPSARPRCSPGGSRCGGPGSGPGRACLAPASAPVLGVLGPALRRSAGPPAWVGGPCRPPRRSRPLLRRAGSPSPGPCRAAPLRAMGRRASSRPGRAWGRRGRPCGRARAPGAFGGPPLRPLCVCGTILGGGGVLCVDTLTRDWAGVLRGRRPGGCAHWGTGDVTVARVAGGAALVGGWGRGPVPPWGPLSRAAQAARVGWAALDMGLTRRRCSVTKRPPASGLCPTKAGQF